MSKFFKGIKEGLEDAIAHKQGKLQLRTEIIEIPEPSAEYKAKDIKKMLTTYKRFLKSLTPKQRKQFNKERKEFLISEMILAAMEHDHISVRKLAELADVSPTVEQRVDLEQRKRYCKNFF